MTDKDNGFENQINEYDKYLIPADISDVKALIRKFGKDINDDYVFAKLTAAIFLEHEINCHREHKYDNELIPIAEEIKKLEIQYEDENNVNNRMIISNQIDKLNLKFDDLLNHKIIELFNRFDLSDFAEAFERNPESFRERFDKIRQQSKKTNLLKEIILNLENEASQCYKIEAYNAASVMISAAIEGILYNECSGNNKFYKALIRYNKNSKNRKKPKKLSTLTFGELINLAQEAKFYPFNTDYEAARKLFNFAKNIRNLIHPGRKLLSQVYTLQKNDYEFLLALFVKLKEFYLR